MISAYDDEGAGPPVLMLHSGICDRRMWRPQVLALGTAHRLVCPDLRGFGETPLPPEEYSHADDLAGLLDHLGIERASVVGSSLGGRVALELAAQHPQRVARLVLLCPAYRLPLSAAAAAFGAEESRLLESGQFDSAIAHSVSAWLGPEADESTRALVATMLRNAWEVQLAADATSPGPRLREEPADLAAVAAPTLVVSGGRDLDHFQHVAEHVAAMVPAAEHRRHAWAGHLPSLERPNEVSALLLEALA